MKIRIITITVFLMLLFCGNTQAALIQEPSTVFYGKIVGVGDVQPFAVYEGSLEWTIKNANGSNSVFTATLYKVNAGEFSYRLDVPHSAVAYELDMPDYGIPLPVVLQTNTHVSASVNGIAADFIGPGGSSFTASQILRAQTIRLDLAINVSAVDTDGDGMPDWWEDLMGLDKQDPSDAYVDSDGDGILNRDEYLTATDANHDDRVPSLVTTDLQVFPESITGVRLKAVDINSSPNELFYTLTATPASGTLVLRNASENPQDPDRQLVVGDSFTQEDVNNGRLIFVHENADAVNNDLFSVILADGTEGGSTSGSVILSFYGVPGDVSLLSTAQKQSYRAYQVAKLNDVVIWDAVSSFSQVVFASPSSGLTSGEYIADYQVKFGDDMGQVMNGGRGDDLISGGMEDDIIVGGMGSDTLSGGGGADIFIFDKGDDASDIITDFNVDEGDLIELNGLLSGRSGMMKDSVSFQVSGSDTLIGLNVNESDTGFTSQVLKLKGVSITAKDAYQLVLDGQLAIGNLKLQPRISVVATDSEASENAGNSGVFTFTRDGDLSSATDVGITIAGTAVNGVDYASIGTTVHFEPGESVVKMVISPYSDGNVESDEIVEISLQGADLYTLGYDTSATLLIKDLQSVVGVEVLEARGSVTPAIPAVFLVTRSGQTANSLFVRLRLGGRASNGVDYTYVSPYVSFAAGQTVIPVTINALSTANLSDGAESVTLEVITDAAYALSDISVAAVVLVNSLDSLTSWKTRMVPDSQSTLADFALQSSGVFGLDYLHCYAYGIDPYNPDSSKLPQLIFRNGHLNLDVQQNPSATDLQYVVEGSTDLLNWSSGVVRTVTVPELVGQTGMVTYEAVSTSVAEPTFFIRVRIINSN